VANGTILAELDQVDGRVEQVSKKIQDAFIIDRDRTITQDLLFGIRQLVDIGLKALSPGINDVTTAEYALYHLGDALGRLAERAFPSNVRTTDNGQTQFLFNRPTWDDIMDSAFSQLRRAAAGDVHATHTLLQVLHDLAARVAVGPRAQAIQQQVAEVRYQITQHAFSPTDKGLLNQMADRVEQALQA